MTVIWISHGAVCAMAIVAAITDYRTGHIPNWLTLPPLVVAPVSYGILLGWPGVGASLLGAVVCGLVPYLLFRKGAAGGGDVKLLAAVGASVGLSVGLAAELLTLVCAALFSLGRLAWEGKLWSTLKSSFFVAANPLMPGRYRRELAPEQMSTVRLGPFVLLGTLLAVTESALVLRVF